MSKTAVLWTLRAPATKKPIDTVKWITWGLWALSAALVIAGLAFLSGYLYAAHSAITTIHHDQAVIAHLSSQLQASNQPGR